MEELQWWISLYPFHIREHKHQSFPWVKPREWLDFELIWHLASHFATTSHTFSESKAKFSFNFCNRELSCWQESCLGWRQGPDSWASSQPPSTFLTWEVLTDFNLWLFIVPSTPATQGFPSVLPSRLWMPAVCTYRWNTLANFGAVPGLWKPSFLHTQHPWKCLLFLLPSSPRVPWQKAERIIWQVVGELIHFLCQFSPFFLPTQLPDFNFMATIRAGALYMLWSEPVVG